MKQSLLLALAGICFSNASLAVEDADAILERVRTGIGLAEVPKQSTLLLGTAEYLGNTVGYRLETSPDGQFRQVFEGPFPVAEGVDGEGAWTRNLSGEFRRLEFSEAECLIVLGQIFGRGWLEKESRLRFEGPPESADGLATLGFKLTDGRTTGQVEIDDSRWRPRRWVVHTAGEASMTIELGGGLDEVAGWFPDRIDVTGTTGRTVPIRLHSATAVPWLTPEPVRQRPEKVLFDAERPSALEVIRARHGHLLVHPRVNGRDLGWFVFDSGAGITVVDGRTVSSLGLQAQGQTLARGSAGRRDAPLHRLDELTLGPMTVRDLAVVELDLAFLDGAMGRPIAGVIGRDLFARSIVEMDIGQSGIALHDPVGFDAGEVEWLVLKFEQGLPVIDVEFESHRGLMLLDTGDYGKASFYPAAVEQLALLEGRRSRGYRQRGVGGWVRGRRAEMEWLQIGDHRFESFEAVFLRDAPGVSPWLTGRIGLGLLDSHRLLLDFSGSRLALISMNE